MLWTSEHSTVEPCYIDIKIKVDKCTFKLVCVKWKPIIIKYRVELKHIKPVDNLS